MSVEDLSRQFRFKSNEDYWYKERINAKCNTVRKIDLDDIRFRELIAWAEIGWNDGDIQIIIQSCDDEHIYFTRDITDISIWNDLMIISWLPYENWMNE